MLKVMRYVAKQFVPYGAMRIWLLKRYGQVLDLPLCYYPGLGKRLRRVVKFMLPYGFVVKVCKRGEGVPTPCTTPRLHPILVAPAPAMNLQMLKQKILIIAELSIPQCKYYRVDQKVAMLTQAGVSVEVDTWTDFYSCLGRLQTATLVVFYRVPYTESVQKLYAEAHRLGLKVGFDIDDLVFDDEEYSKNTNLMSLSKSEQKVLLNGAQLYRQALAAADFSIASTRTLQTYMKKYCGGNSYVVPNCISKAGGHSDDIAFPLGKGKSFVIGYGSGTTTHDADFKLCANAVLRIMKEFSDVVFVLHGTLNLPKGFDEMGSRVIRVGFVPFDVYSRVLGRFDVNLIPLESGTFNTCKSNIKYLEASLMGVPSIASPLVEFTSVITDGVDGFIARDEKQWYHALRKLVVSRTLCRRIGQHARQTVLSSYGSSGVFSKMFRPVLLEQQMRRIRQRKRMLVVNVLYPPVSFGGATVLCESLATEYGKSMDVCVFTLSMDVWHYPGHMIRYANRGEMCFLVEYCASWAASQNWDIPNVRGAFQKVLNSFEPDVVHFNSIQYMGVQLVEECQKRGLPYFVTAHDAWWICERQFMLDQENRFCAQDAYGVDLYKCSECTKTKTLFTRWDRLQRALRGARMVLTPSNYQTELYVKSGVPRCLVRTNRNGVSVPDNVPSHQVHSPIVFAYMGGACSHKGYYFLQNVVRMLRGEYLLKLVDLNLKFGQRSMVVSDWPSPSQVEICVPFDHHEMDEFYKDIDVLLFPSCWKEAFGLTVREALARNVWVISTRAGGDIEEEVCDGVNGDLVDLFDRDGFARAMQRIIDNPNRLINYDNPRRGAIRTVADQAREAMAFMEDRIWRQTDQ